MLPLLIPAALAAAPPTSAELERALLQEGPAPVVAARCNPLSIVASGVDALSSLPIPLGQELQKLNQLGTAALTDAGFGLDAPVQLEAWGKGDSEAVWMSLPFHGDVAAAHDWLAGLGGTVGEVEADHFSVGQKGLVATVSKGALTLARGEPPQGAAWHPPAGLLDDVPMDGCVALVAVPELPGSKAEKLPSALMVHFSAGEDSTALMRAAMKQPIPEPLQSRKSARLHLGRAKEPPMMVMTVGVSLSAIIGSILDLKDMPQRFQTVQVPLSELALALDGAGVELAPGASVAVWRSGALLPRGPRIKVAAVLPVRTREGGHVPGKRLLAGLKRGLEGKGLTVSEEDGQLVVEIPRGKLLLSARRDLLFISTDAELLGQTRARLKGKPWANHDFKAFAEDWGLAVTSQGAAGPTGTGQGVVGLRARDNLVELSASGSGGMSAGMSGMTSAMLIGALSKLGGKLDDTFKGIDQQIEVPTPPEEPQGDAPQKP